MGVPGLRAGRTRSGPGRKTRGARRNPFGRGIGGRANVSKPVRCATTAPGAAPSAVDQVRRITRGRMGARRTSQPISLPASSHGAATARRPVGSAEVATAGGGCRPKGAREAGIPPPRPKAGSRTDMTRPAWGVRSQTGSDGYGSRRCGPCRVRQAAVRASDALRPGYSEAKRLCSRLVGPGFRSDGQGSSLEPCHRFPLPVALSIPFRRPSGERDARSSGRPGPGCNPPAFSGAKRWEAKQQSQYRHRPRPLATACSPRRTDRLP